MNYWLPQMCLWLNVSVVLVYTRNGQNPLKVFHKFNRGNSSVSLNCLVHSINIVYGIVCVVWVSLIRTTSCRSRSEHLLCSVSLLFVMKSSAVFPLSEYTSKKHMCLGLRYQYEYHTATVCDKVVRGRCCCSEYSQPLFLFYC